MRVTSRTVAVSMTAFAMFMTGCIPHAPGTAPVPGELARTSDSHSFSRPHEVSIEHISLDLGVDFERQQLAGRATLSIDNHTGASELVLDTRDLDIRGVTLGSARQPAQFALGEEGSPNLGRPLTIQLRPGTDSVTIDYATSPGAAAIQWLTKEQTSDGKHPFLLTQSQAILARTWIPLQDTPTVRFTYDATIRVPAGLLAVMSAENPTEKNASGVYTFRMPQAIPSYLMALAVGDLAFHAWDARTGVYAEPSVIEKAAWEFEDTPKMMTAAENLYGPYRWGRYDLLVLPPSFPFGGMENPRLTFATPTILAGDRSLVALVAHELAHSWSGNLATNATWNDFWLNEGFTTYFTQRIMEEVYGREYSEMLALLSMQDLESEVSSLGAASADTHLFLDLEGRDPDEGMTRIAYYKGYFFLRMIEEAVGRKTFDAFLRSYFDRYAFRSLTTQDFLADFEREFLRGDPSLRAKLRIDEWVYGPGIPSNAPRPQSPAFTEVEAQLARFSGGAAPASLATADWTTHEWLHFLRNLPAGLSRDRMAALDSAFKLTQSGNSEIQAIWFEQSLKNNYSEAYPAMERFLTTMGRRKFLTPLYSEMVKTPEGKVLAMKIYRQARPGYHSVSRQTIDGIVGWPG